MYEKCNKSHPDKIADRIAGAIVDLAYEQVDSPHIAVEVLIGHGECKAIIESDVSISPVEIDDIVERLAGHDFKLEAYFAPQDKHLNKNQSKEVRCGDNGIFKGCPVTDEQRKLTVFAKKLYKQFPYDGKFVLDNGHMTICQSHMSESEGEIWRKKHNATVNPLGSWEGGLNVDSGATNRKLGSDMGDAVTGGGLHGKDLSKADVTLNIMCHLLAQKHESVVTTSCAIGSTEIVFNLEKTGIKQVYTYTDCVKRARKYIKDLGGFEAFAEWGLIR